MNRQKVQLQREIETVRVNLNKSIECGEHYEKIYDYSVELDYLIVQYLELEKESAKL